MNRRVGFLALGVLACSDPYGGGAPAPSDAGTEAAVGPGTPDATTDAPVSDGGVDAGPSCGWVPIIERFDSETFPMGWTRKTGGTGAKIDVDSMAGSPPNSLRGGVIASDAGANGYDYLERTLSLSPGVPAPSCAHFAFDLNVGSQSGPSVGIAAIEMENDTAVSVSIAPNELHLIAQTIDGNTFEKVLELPISFGVLHRIVFRHEGGMAPPTLSIDGSTAVLTPPSVQLGAPRRVRIGVNFSSTETLALFHIDNVDVR